MALDFACALHPIPRWEDWGQRLSKCTHDLPSTAVIIHWEGRLCVPPLTRVAVDSLLTAANSPEDAVALPALPVYQP